MRHWNGPLALVLLLLFAPSSLSKAHDLFGAGDLPPVNYSRPNISDEYQAEGEFNNVWYLELLYDITDGFIDLLAPRQVLPSDAIEVHNLTIEFKANAGKWLGHYGAITGLIVIGLLVAIFLPVIGLCLLCCYDSRGSEGHPKEADSLRRRRNVVGSLLFVVGVAIIIGVVGSSLSNQAFENGSHNVPVAFKDSIHDIKLYVVNFLAEIETLFGRNFQELASSLANLLRLAGEYVVGKLSEISDAVALIDLDNIVSGLNSINNDLKSINRITVDLKANASQLETRLKLVRTSLENTLMECGDPCEPIKEESKIEDINIAAHFEQLPTKQINDAFTKVQKLLDDGIVNKVRQGVEEFEKIEIEVQKIVNSTAPKFSENIERASRWLAENIKNITDVTDNSIRRSVEEVLEPRLNDASDYIDEYSPYRYYSSMVVSMIGAVVAACLIIGIFCGLCDKRPGDYDRCCGSCFLTTAVWIIFLVSSLLIVMTIGLMFAGVVSDRLICEPLERPRDNRLIMAINQILTIKDKSLGFEFPKINLAEIMNSCEKNYPLTRAMGIDKVIDPKSWSNLTERFDINKTMKEITEKIKLRDDYAFITEGTEKQLDELVESGLDDINFRSYTDLLLQNITGIDLSSLASKLRGFAGLENLPEKTKKTLTDNAAELDNCQVSYVVPMTNSIRQLATTATELEKHIKFNRTSLKEAVNELVEKVKETQKLVNKNGPEIVKTIAAEFTTSLFSLMTGFVDHVNNQVMNEIGKCGPIANVYNAVLVATCDKILSPFNGFWLSIGWCLIFFIPAIILAMKLNSAQRQLGIHSGSSFDLNKNIEPIIISPKNPMYRDEPAYMAAQNTDYSSRSRFKKH